MIGLAPHQHIVRSRRRRGYDRVLIGLKRIRIRRVVIGPARQAVIFQIEHVARSGVGGGEIDAQRRALRHDDLEQLIDAGIERHGARRSQRELRRVELQGLQRNPDIVVLTRLRHFVVHVGAHEDAIGAGQGGRQRHRLGHRVALARREQPRVDEARDGRVVNVPDVVGREIERVGPRANGRIDPLVRDLPGDADRVAGQSARRGGYGRHDEIGGRGHVDQDRRDRCGGVVAISIRLIDGAVGGIGGRRIGLDDHVPGAA